MVFGLPKDGRDGKWMDGTDGKWKDGKDGRRMKLRISKEWQYQQRKVANKEMVPTDKHKHHKHQENVRHSTVHLLPKFHDARR